MLNLAGCQRCRILLPPSSLKYQVNLSEDREIGMT